LKREFEFQHFYRRWLSALPCLALALGLNALLEPLRLPTAAYLLTCVGIMLALLAAYSSASAHWALFRGTGYYWISEDILHLQVGKKQYAVSNVTELFGDIKSVYGRRHALLLIETDAATIKLFSTPLSRAQGFEDSSLFPLYSLVKCRADDLSPVTVKAPGQEAEVTYWYRKM
jgi:hypothetical protein